MIDEHNNLESPDLSSETVLEDETVETKLSPESSVSEVDLSPETELEEIPSVFDALELESEQGINMQASLEIANLQQKLDALQSQLDQRNEQYVRIAADFENFRKRTERDKEELGQQIRSSTILEILPVLDTFARAKEQLKPESEEAQKVHNSYQGVYKQFLDCLKRVGVVPMQCEGQEFDPSLHNAIMREPTHQYPEGIIIQEFQPGYVLGERVLRHAMVKVAAAWEGDAAVETNE